MASTLADGVNPKYGVAGYPAPTSAPTSSNVAQTSDGMFSGFLEPSVAQDYFAQVEKVSIVQQLAQKIPLGPSGVRIPHWNGNVTAKWTAEGGKKPITKGDFTKQDVVPYKIATIFVASAETVRANPLNYLNVMRVKVAEAIALAFDNAVLNGVDNPFGASIADTTKSVSLSGDAYAALNNGLSLLLADGKKWNGTLFDDVAEPLLNGTVDAAGRPLFIDATYADINAPFRSGRVLGRPTYLSDHVKSGTTVGYMGDWTQLVWGQIGGLSYDVTDQATLDLSTAQDGTGITSLWQNNLVAVRVEAEYAALVNDKDAFVKLTDVAP
jgi:HK97 family phage major capsid protein